eukprot:4424925-Amphidinium_carterae.1
MDHGVYFSPPQCVCYALTLLPTGATLEAWKLHSAFSGVTSACDVVKKWKTFATLFAVARSGIRSDGKSFRLMTRRPPVFGHELALEHRAGVHTVWTDVSGTHSKDPHHRRRAVGYYTDTQEKVWLKLPGLRQSVYRAEFLVAVRALEECQPR